ncbi:MAG: peptidase domain-containing ABC transporter [Ferruginibacter sp.]|nr:peptidase domain-containing ABC transporter [Ferruginibacter sp.]
MDCGPTCLAMICRYYGKSISLQTLRSKTEIGKEGVNLLGINNAAVSIGFRTQGVQLTYKQITKEAPLPCILHWGQHHFVVLLKVKSSFFAKFSASPLSFWRGAGGEVVTIADPGKGIIKLSKEEFLQHWASSNLDGEAYGVALLLEPTPDFHNQQSEKENKLGWGILLGYFAQQKRYIIQLFIGLLLGSLLQLIFPFLTQSIVDTGINQHNLPFIYLILAAQFMLFFGRTVVDFIRSRILLHISTKINLAILSDFWIKLMKLPLSYFDTKQTGDIIQRIGDHKRIESFLTGSALSTLFSLFNLVIFSVVLLQYNTYVFGIFCAGSVLYFLWIKIFLRYRRSLNYRQFAIAAKENTATMQLIYGMQEIKLNGAEHLRRWEWEGLQAGLFKLSFKSLSLSQYQQAGAFFINEGKNILITFFVAKSVMEGQLTLGAMLAVQYIIGQLNSPVEQLINFTQQAQDAKISLERLNEIHQMEEEEPADAALAKQLPVHKSIHLNNLSFTYAGAGNEPVLKNINLIIPEGKTTAIVGMSGSGKTTLLKLLLKFYENYSGEIKIGTTASLQSINSSSPFTPPWEGIGEAGVGVGLKYISPKYWRSHCGSVMQDGYIFNDSIAKNIAVSDDRPDYAKLLHACKVANIQAFIESLPLGFNTKIGAEGNGISAGQKQRILIARAVYKNPEFIFFDEATNSLDANNEKVIMENLSAFFKDKTVVVVAHRLSTVKHADNIVVLHNGQITETGTHEELAMRKGEYFELVKNQLELGN